MAIPVTSSSALHQFPCSRCGADLTYAPDASALRCARCGHEEAIADGGEAPPELDYATLQREGEEAMPHEELLLVPCGNCGAVLCWSSGGRIESVRR